MFKSKNKQKYIFGLLSLIGLGIIFSIRSTIASTNTVPSKNLTISNALDTLDKKIQKTTEIDKIFDGETNIDNLYDKALEITKANTLKSTRTTLDQINFMLPQTTNEKANKQDLLNVLYDSNNYVRKITDRIHANVSETAIQNSYNTLAEQIPFCKEKNKNTKDRRDCVQQWVNNSFSLLEQNTKDIQTFNQDNYGEDIFLNGSTEDSSYDLITDIDRIGNLLFNSFKAPVETLFYQFPKIQGNNTQGGSNGGATNLAALLQNLQQKNTQATSNNSSNNPTTSIGSTSTTTNKTSNTTVQNNTTNVQDPGIQNFIQDTKNNTTSINGTPQGNGCITSLAENLPSETNSTQISSGEIQKYLTTLNNFIANNAPYQENKNLTNLTTTNGTKGTGDTNTNLAQAVANKIDEIFDPEQVQKCSDKCNTLSNSDKVICQIQCLCFSVSYPNPPYTDSKLVSMNDALKLRFCTIPVQANRISRGSDVLSWDDMLTKIKETFQSLLNGGQMVKYQRTKEYLDNPIADLKFSKMISFEIALNSKPIFNNKTAKAQQVKETNQSQKVESAVADKNSNPGIDTNKYVIISDILKTKTDKEFGANLDDYTQKLNEAKTKEKSVTVNQDNLNNLQNTINNKSILINETVIDFLNKNSNFRYGVTEQMLNLNQLTNILKNKL